MSNPIPAPVIIDRPAIVAADKEAAAKAILAQCLIDLKASDGKSLEAQRQKGKDLNKAFEAVKSITPKGEQTRQWEKWVKTAHEAGVCGVKSRQAADYLIYLDEHWHLIEARIGKDITTLGHAKVAIFNARYPDHKKPEPRTGGRSNKQSVAKQKSKQLYERLDKAFPNKLKQQMGFLELYNAVFADDEQIQEVVRLTQEEIVSLEQKLQAIKEASEADEGSDDEEPKEPAPKQRRK